MKRDGALPHPQTMALASTSRRTPRDLSATWSSRRAPRRTRAVHRQWKGGIRASVSRTIGWVSGAERHAHLFRRAQVAPVELTRRNGDPRRLTRPPPIAESHFREHLSGMRTRMLLSPAAALLLGATSIGAQLKAVRFAAVVDGSGTVTQRGVCLLYTSDAADERSSV